MPYTPFTQAPTDMTPFAGNYWGGNRPGESAQWQLAYRPLIEQMNRLNAVGQGAYNQVNDPTGNNANAYMGGILPGLVQAYGVDPNTRAALLQTYQAAAQPMRQQQMGQLGDTLANMAMGGGRGARALAEQQKGFGTQDLAMLQQLLGADVTGRQQAAGAATQLYGQNFAQQAGLLNNAMSGGNSIADRMSQLPWMALEAYKPTPS